MKTRARSVCGCLLLLLLGGLGLAEDESAEPVEVFIHLSDGTAFRAHDLRYADGKFKVSRPGGVEVDIEVDEAKVVRIIFGTDAVEKAQQDYRRRLVGRGSPDSPGRGKRPPLPRDGKGLRLLRITLRGPPYDNYERRVLREGIAQVQEKLPDIEDTGAAMRVILLLVKAANDLGELDQLAQDCGSAVRDDPGQSAGNLHRRLVLALVHYVREENARANLAVRKIIEDYPDARDKVLWHLRMLREGGPLDWDRLLRRGPRKEGGHRPAIDR